MDKVFIVEHRINQILNPETSHGPVDYEFECSVMYAASTLEKAIDYIKANPDADDKPTEFKWWWWAIYSLSVDSEKDHADYLGYFSWDGAELDYQPIYPNSIPDRKSLEDAG